MTIDIAKLSPKHDLVFRYIFGQQEHAEILCGLLRTILDFKIESIEILNPFQVGSVVGEKAAILDILARTDDQSKVHIEMQLFDKKDTIPRSLIYLARILGKQPEKGQSWKAIQRCVSINILDFKLFHREDRYHNVYQIINKHSGNTLTDLVSYHFIEIPKLSGDVHDDHLLAWMKFLDSPTADVIADISQIEPLIKEANKMLERLKKDEQALLALESQERFQQDHESRMIEARKEGREEGMEKGREEGMEKGREEGRKNGLRVAFKVRFGHAGITFFESMNKIDTRLADKIESLLSDESLTLDDVKIRLV